jgi:hypothetical protein
MLRASGKAVKRGDRHACQKKVRRASPPIILVGEGAHHYTWCITETV